MVGVPVTLYRYTVTLEVTGQVDVEEDDDPEDAARDDAYDTIHAQAWHRVTDSVEVEKVKE